MNFGEKIKKELFSKLPKETHCKKAFLAGVIRGAGGIYEDGENLGLQIRLSSEDLANEVGDLLKLIYDYDLREIMALQDKLNGKDKFVITIRSNVAEKILKDLNVLVLKDGEKVVNLKFYDEITQKECCLRNFIKGLFISSGNCTIPDSRSEKTTGYHLEIAFSHYTPALETSEKLAEFGVITKITRRKESFIVYIKSAEEIKDFIAFLPAPVCVLKLTDFMIERDIANNSNRQKNCDLGNVNRQIEASAKQIEAIEKIDSTIRLETLKKDLCDTAKLRREYPEDTLSELAERLSVTKSCLNHRLRKIIEIAKEL